MASKQAFDPIEVPATAAPSRTGAWLALTANLFRERLDKLPDSALDVPARLPGWSRRHVLGHLHCNALVLGRLARSLIVGAPVPLGTPLERWQAWRERSERMPAGRLRDLARWAEEDLEVAFGDVDVASRVSRVAAIPGVRVPAEKLPWLRLRELVIHLPDLDDTLDPGDLPADLIARVAADVPAPGKRRSGGPGPAFGAGDSWSCP